MGVLVTFIRLVLAGSLFLLVVALLPQSVFPRFSIEPVAYHAPNHTQYAKELSNNVIGEKSSRLLLNKVHGPESLAIKGDKLYTGLGDGRLVEVNLVTEEIRLVARFSSANLAECGKFRTVA